MLCLIYILLFGLSNLSNYTMTECYPVLDFQEYPFYKISTSDKDLTLYLFGSQHNKKLQSIHPFIADILINSDELTTEITYAYNDFNIEVLLEYMTNDCDLSDILVACCNSYNKIDNKIQKRKFYELSGKYMLGELFIKELLHTTYFKNNTTNLTNFNINDVSFTTACPMASLLTSFVSNGIDNTLLLMYRKNKKQCYALDNTKESYYWYVRLLMMFMANTLYYLFMMGIFMSGKHFNDVFNDLKKGVQKITISNCYSNKNSINDVHLIQKRNDIWVPKILNTLSTSNAKSHVICVGCAHIDDLIEKLRTHRFSRFRFVNDSFLVTDPFLITDLQKYEVGIEIEKWNYETNSFLDINSVQPNAKKYCELLDRLT
jgi:hypothetical protein